MSPVSDRGLKVAFLGQDGAGKTTVTGDVLAWLGGKAEYVYLGSGENYSSWRKTLQEKLPKWGIFKVFRAWLQLSKYKMLSRDVLDKVRLGEKISEKGGVVIYDRYPQTQFPGICDGPKVRLMLEKLPKWSRWLFRGYARKEEKNLSLASGYCPDIVFKLLLSPEESVRRKPENKLESMKRKRSVIESLKFEGSEVITVDAEMPYEEEIQLIKSKITDRLSVWV